MALDYPAILALQENGRRFVYTDRDTMLYAIAIGLGSDPLNEADLPFVYEKHLRAVPTLATVVCWGAGVSTDKLGVNYSMVLHGEEEILFHRPLAAAGTIIVDSGIAEVYDKGKDKGALIIRRTVLRDERDGEPIATINRGLFARADGGCGGVKSATPAPHRMPDRSCDVSLELPSRPDQAALYRLCGDRNPLHIDPAAAAKGGFKAPILHGLCTYGVTCRAVLQAFCDYDPSRIASHAARFSAPFYPGEVLKVDLWRDGDVVSFEASVPARGVTVIKSGKSVLRPSC
jgi:acyl dehydratase